MAKRAVAAAVALLATSWLLYTFYDRFWYPPDEGNYAHVAQRILDGETLNLQVQDVHPGYISFVNAAALRLFGSDLVSLRYPLVLAGLVQAAVLFLVFPRDDPWRAAVATVSLDRSRRDPVPQPHRSLAMSGTGDRARRHDRAPAPRTSADSCRGILLGHIALLHQLTGFLVGLGALHFCSGGGRTWSRGPRRASSGEGSRRACLPRLAAYLIRATEVGGIVLFGVWPLALLARLAFRPQAPNREVARIAGTRPRASPGGDSPGRRITCGTDRVQAWADDVGPAAVALTRMDFFDRGNFGALVFHGRDKIGRPG